MTRGRFITLEGGEGSGKSTQIRLLEARLADAGIDVVVTREPGGTPEAEKIRALLVNRDGGDWSAQAETMLFFAARAMHVRDLIAPALAAGKTVLCDRFTDSTRAYQGAAGGIGSADIEALKQIAIGDLEPDLTIILDVPVEIGLKRANFRNVVAHANEARFEDKDVAFHERLRAGYLAIAKASPQRCHVIDATQTEADVAEAIHKRVSA